MALVELLDEWRDDPPFAQNVAAWKRLPARPARAAPFPADLHPLLAQALRQRGISELYTHQHSAWNAAREARHLVVVTATASGKTLCYNLPVLNNLLREPDARALYLFPTKALAQDQADELRQLVATWVDIPGAEVQRRARTGSTAAPLKLRSSRGKSSVPVGLPQIGPNNPVATYDGDTPADMRPGIRTQARLVLTNPDMLHTGILPHHTR